MLETHSTLFDFAAELTRSHAVLLRDDPNRVAPPEYTDRPCFEDLPRSQQLDIAETVCRWPSYRDALSEALPESDGYDGFLKLAIDANVSDSELGRRARELILQYLSRVAAIQGDELEEVLA